MGYSVIGFGEIECGEFNDDNIKKIIGYLEEENKTQKNTFTRIETDGIIYFEMSGNKGLDYNPLNRVKEKILNLGTHPFNIRVSEYMECDDGYYFDTEELK